MYAFRKLRRSEPIAGKAQKLGSSELLMNDETLLPGASGEALSE